jgi:hypothetical protein
MHAVQQHLQTLVFFFQINQSTITMNSFFVCENDNTQATCHQKKE